MLFTSISKVTFEEKTQWLNFQDLFELGDLKIIDCSAPLSVPRQ